jgi:hypothetical protein
MEREMVIFCFGTVYGIVFMRKHNGQVQGTRDSEARNEADLPNQRIHRLNAFAIIPRIFSFFQLKEGKSAVH